MLLLLLRKKWSSSYAGNSIEIGVSATAGEPGTTIAGTTTIGASAFMEEMLGTDSDWASGLGTQFEQSLKTKYALNTRSKRAW